MQKLRFSVKSVRTKNRTKMTEERTAQDYALSDICIIADYARALNTEISKRNGNVRHSLQMGNIMEASKLTIEISYFTERLSKLLYRIGARVEKTMNPDFKETTLENFYDLKLPSDFWEQQDNKNRLQGLTKGLLTNGKLQYQ